MSLDPTPAPVPTVTAPPSVWTSRGAAIGSMVAAGIAPFGGVISTFQAGSGDHAAEQAKGAQYVTMEVAQQAKERLDRINARSVENERRIAELEKQVAVLQAMQKGR